MPARISPFLTLVLLIVNLVSAGAPAVAQATGAPSPPAPVPVMPSAEGDEVICLSSRHQVESITFGHGPKRIEITLGGGTCEPPGLGISDLWVRYPAEDQKLDVVSTRDCPALRQQVAILRLVEAQRLYGKTRNIRAGLFVIDGGSGLFELRRKSGRVKAVHWVRQTLAAVRPCWNTVRNDRSRAVVDSLYRGLAM